MDGGKTKDTFGALAGKLLLIVGVGANVPG